jgi:hypothetical protein
LLDISRLQASDILLKAVDGSSQPRDADRDDGMNVGEGTSHLTDLLEHDVVRRKYGNKKEGCREKE